MSHIKQLRVRLSAELHDKFRILLPEHGQRSRAVRRFVRIFCEEYEREMNRSKAIDSAALQAVQELLVEE